MKKPPKPKAAKPRKAWLPGRKRGAKPTLRQVENGNRITRLMLGIRE